MTRRAGSALPMGRLQVEGQHTMRATRFIALVIGAMLYCGGCTSTARPPTAGTPEGSLTGGRSAAPQEHTGPSAWQRQRLAALWQERAQHRTGPALPLGPGDVLEISVPAIPDLRERTVRIAGEGTITLPFLGVVQASGLSDEALGAEIRRRLGVYMHYPQVSLFVREYRSRHVAVLGAVAKPGLYTLASGADSILGMLAAAGGTTEEAASYLLFLPAEFVGAPGPMAPAQTDAPLRLVSLETQPALPPSMDPLTIDLQALQRGENHLSLTLPARPGDVMLVPNAGQVLVEGWVEKPGAYKITAALTVLGAVAAAGGPQFPADTTAVRVIRAGQGDGKVILLANLEAIKRGTEPDMPVRAGDVVEVSSSAVKMVPYGLYRFFSAVLNVGVGASVPLR